MNVSRIRFAAVLLLSFGLGGQAMKLVHACPSSGHVLHDAALSEVESEGWGGPDYLAFIAHMERTP